MLQEFRDFINRGNVMDLAVAVIIGGAFGKIVSSLVNDIVMPLVGLVLGNVDFANLFVALDGKTYAWRPFYEPFGGDRYLLGPEYDEQVPAGAYTVVVTSPDNTGKYVLAVGKIEKFPPKAMARTIVALLKLKRYFGKSPWTAFFNLSGAFLLVAIGAVTGLAALFF